MIRSEKTICAPATAPGGAIALIRISGQDSLTICEKLFFPIDKSIKIIDQKGFTVVFGEIRSGKEIIMKYF